MPGPLTLWRISLYENLDGKGAARGGGRWNSPGNAVVYLAESPADAMLEMLVHLSMDIDMPDAYRLLRVEARSSVEVAQVEGALPKAWESDSVPTQQIGDAWLKGEAAALLRVPSAIMPHTWNYLLNPAHPDAVDLRIVGASSHLYDPRLLRVRTR